MSIFGLHSASLGHRKSFSLTQIKTKVAMQRHALTDREWARLEPLLPRAARTGRPAKDHRTIINALLWLLSTGAPWRDLPERFGPWRSVATRFYRWTHSGLWERILAELRRIADAEDGVDWEVHIVDATNVRAHRHAAAQRAKNAQALGRMSGRHGGRPHTSYRISGGFDMGS
jgi:transposase